MNLTIAHVSRWYYFTFRFTTKRLAVVLLRSCFVWNLVPTTVWQLLLIGIHIVMISEADLSCAESFFRQFYEQYPALYGEYIMFFEMWITCCRHHIGPNAATMKCHLLRHVVPCVKRWGPIWAYSCFAFEGMNHTIRKLFHGTQDANKEVGVKLRIIWGWYQWS